ncbi:hypothetical protein MMC13_002951 [Lambiella insularis]|nr:hypothetical protein [Lambiella insularis]
MNGPNVSRLRSAPQQEGNTTSNPPIRGSSAVDGTSVSRDEIRTIHVPASPLAVPSTSYTRPHDKSASRQAESSQVRKARVRSPYRVSRKKLPQEPNKALGNTADPSQSSSSAISALSSSENDSSVPIKYSHLKPTTQDYRSEKISRQDFESNNPLLTPEALPQVVQVVKHGKKRELLIAFGFIFVPMTVLAIALLIFVHKKSGRVKFNDEDLGTSELPAVPRPPSNAYYTTFGIGSFLLLASWTSTAAGVVLTPFMLLFSFIVAQEIAKHHTQDASIPHHDSHLLREMLSGTWRGIWHWIEHIIYRVIGDEKGLKKGTNERRATHVAALGFIFAGLLSFLVIVGDNWLHIYTDRVQLRYFEPVKYPATDPLALNASTDFYAAGWTTIDQCSEFLSTTLPKNRSAGMLPCSLNATTGLLNLEYAPYTYLTLEAGISQVSANFNAMNFTTQSRSENTGTGTNERVITYVDPDTDISHSMLFYPDAAMEYQYYEAMNYGIDYVANTISMSTDCTFATEQCQLKSKLSTDQNMSIPYNCSAEFNGDLNQTPLNGLERAQGWNMSFYELANGVPESIPYQAQSNPFFFFAAAAIDSVSYSPSDDAQIQFVDAGKGRIAFALNCSATIYDIRYSLINGSIAEFHPTPSNATIASIIQAPLQVGFGQFRLLQTAAAAAPASVPYLVSMQKAFSQVGMAAASGAFTFDKNIQQRYRYDVLVTMVPMAPFWFLVVTCLLYSAAGLVTLAAALLLRKDSEIRRHQADLVPYPTSYEYEKRFRELVKNPWKSFKRWWKERQRRDHDQGSGHYSNPDYE